MQLTATLAAKRTKNNTGQKSITAISIIKSVLSNPEPTPSYTNCKLLTMYGTEVSKIESRK